MPLPIRRVVGPVVVWLGALSVVALCAAGGANAQSSPGLPGAATPGGALPERPLLVPFRVMPGQRLIAPATPTPSGSAIREKFAVRRIVLVGANEHPGIDLAELNRLVERMRRASVGDEPVGLVERFLSLQRLGEIAGVVTRYYRDRGLILAQAFVPAQTIEDGRVVIQVLEGVLSGVTVEGAKRADWEDISRLFDDLIGKPVQQQSVEDALLAADGYPGIDVFGVFRPGPDPGTSELVLKVEEAPLVTANLSVDNHGNEFTGKIRTRADMVMNNPTTSGDRLVGTALLGLSPANTVYGSVEYTRPLWHVDTLAGVRLSSNAFDLGASLEALGLSGSSRETELYLDQTLSRTRAGRRYLRGGLTLKHAEIGAPINKEDALTVAALEWGFDRHIGRRGGSHLGAVTLHRGIAGMLGAMAADNDPQSSRIGGSGLSAGAAFTKLSARYERLTPVTGSGTLWLRGQFQYSSDLLTSIEQMAIGGPNTVRAYPVSEFLVDKGFALSVEWLNRFPLFTRKQAFRGHTWGELLRVSVFVDAAGGVVNDPLITEESFVRLTGAGVALRFTMERLAATLEVASPIGGPKPSDGDDPQIYFSVGYAL